MEMLTSIVTRRSLTWLFFLSIICTLSFLVGLHVTSLSSLPATTPAATTAYTFPNTTTASIFPNSTSFLDFEAHHFPSDVHYHPSPSPPSSESDDVIITIPFCLDNFTNHCPCQDRNRERGFRTDNMFHRERHCPPKEILGLLRCRVPRPRAYRTPFKWPESRHRAWFANVPSKRLSQVKAGQNWVRVEGNQLVFPGGGTSFPEGVKGYVADLGKIVPINTGEIRTVLDIGCGVASFGGHLLNFNILTLSVAPRDVHEAQVQFALERGLPAMLGVLSVYRLPYPSKSFNMVHCARCLIQWAGYGGLYLLEIDRVLQPGGYWVLSGPPINYKHMYKGWKRPLKDLQAEQTAIEDVAKQLCWKKIKEKSGIAVWRKPLNHDKCVKKSNSNAIQFCDTTDLDSAWYRKMENCISPLPKGKAKDHVANSIVENWPKRLNAIPPRIRDGYVRGVTAEKFTNDNKIWNKRLTYYERHIKFVGKYRNIMDMNAGFGGFAAALTNYPVWVMNSVPADTTNNTLGVIFERGLIGTYMDWCEAFSTYPRTYDLIHADGIFSMYSGKCDIIDILLEMDRILRPKGAVIIRDHVDFITKVKRASESLSWQSRIVHTEKGAFDPEKLLVIDNSIPPTRKNTR